MEFSVLKMINNFLRENKNKHRWLAIFLCLAVVVALSTTAALKLTGIAQIRKLKELKCPVEIHKHVDSCYDVENNLICGYADFVIHTHSLDCYLDDKLICKLPEIEAHEHTEDCYTQEEMLICDQTESEKSDKDEDHKHTDECYEVQNTLICDEEEIIPHTHTDDCFKKAVFDENGIMVSLISELPVDVTVPDTWTYNKIPACGQLQIEKHTHGAGCLETVELPPEEAKNYVSSMNSDETKADSEDNKVSDKWSGTNEGKDCKDIADDNGTKTVQEQFTWSATINFPDDESWTDFTYTDSLSQTMTGWITQENGEKTWDEDHTIHHYQILSKLDKELNGALRSCLKKAGLEEDLTYTFVYKDQDGKEVTDEKSEVVCFEIHFERETGQNLYGQSISFGYTSLVDTENFADNTEYVIYNDFTLPDFTGKGSISFQYTDRFYNESETGEISVKNIWLDEKGNPLTDNLPDNVEMVLKQYAFKGGICLTEKPENTENWCKLILHIDQDVSDDKHDVNIKTLDKEILGKNTAKVWIPRNSKIKLIAGDDSSWSDTFKVKDVSSRELTITVNEDYNNVFLNVIGKAPADFTPSDDFIQYGDTIKLNGVDDDWSHTWKQVPLDNDNDIQYVYMVEEAEVPDGYYSTVEYDGEGVFTIINRKSMEPGKITVEMKWVNVKGEPLVTHPDTVEIELEKKVEKLSSGAKSELKSEDEWVTVENSSITLPNDEGKWTASWTNLEDGDYRVVEKAVKGYAVLYIYTTYDDEGNALRNTESLAGNTGFVTITNIEVLAEDGDLIVEKVWEYEDGTPDDSHPDSVDIVIKRAKPTEDSSETPSEPTSSEPTSTEPTSSAPTTSVTTPSRTDSSEPESSETVTTKAYTNNGKSGSFLKNPFTGDEANLIPYIIAALICGILLLIFAIYSFKHRNEKDEKETEEDTTEVIKEDAEVSEENIEELEEKIEEIEEDTELTEEDTEVIEEDADE